MRPPLTALALPLLLAALPQASLAESLWTGTAELGLAIASGNAESETLNGKLDLKRETERWHANLRAAALRAEADDQLSAYRYALGGTLGFNVGARAYTFGAVRYERDDFAAFRHQWVGSAGLGYRLIDDERTALVGEIGPGARRAQLVAWPSSAPAGTRARMTETDTILRASVEFRHALNANTQLSNVLLSEGGSSGRFLQNDLGLSVRISERYALRVGHQLRRNSDAENGIVATDRLFTTNWVVGF